MNTSRPEIFKSIEDDMFIVVQFEYFEFRPQPYARVIFRTSSFEEASTFMSNFGRFRDDTEDNDDDNEYDTGL